MVGGSENEVTAVDVMVFELSHVHFARGRKLNTFMNFNSDRILV